MPTPSNRSSQTAIRRITRLMRAEKLPELAIANFRHYYLQLVAGSTGYLRGTDIEPVTDLPDLERIAGHAEKGREALAHAVVIKLNGGLGTGMGLGQAKSLLPVKNDLTFLDILVRQVLGLRSRHRVGMPLLLMDSFSTEEDTRRALHAYPELEAGQPGIPATFLQHKVPKIRQDNLLPAEWPQDPAKAWCPPGHGDIYTALVTSGELERLLAGGYRYAFVSNADNLGAVLDVSVLGYFAASGSPFMMEVADRTYADRKGGHLARSRDGGLLLRESAQCPPEELSDFQNVERYRYFNTNNLWVDIQALQSLLKERKGVLGLPLIRNSKTVDPADKASPAVYQLETAMGAAISVFPAATALRVPRSRFAPVKSTDDLLALWSDIYMLNDQWEVAVDSRREHGTVVIHLDPRYFKHMAQFRERFPDGAPSLLECTSLTVEGDVRFGRGVMAEGSVTITNESGRQGVIADGTHLAGTYRIE